MTVDGDPALAPITNGDGGIGRHDALLHVQDGDTRRDTARLVETSMLASATTFTDRAVRLEATAKNIRVVVQNTGHRAK